MSCAFASQSNPNRQHRAFPGARVLQPPDVTCLLVVAHCVSVCVSRIGARVSNGLLVTMAEKEATVYIVDVGKSMGERRGGRSVTDLEWAMRYVWDRITATVNMKILADALELLLMVVS